jgi:hypothetical protein
LVSGLATWAYGPLLLMRRQPQPRIRAVALVFLGCLQQGPGQLLGPF